MLAEFHDDGPRNRQHREHDALESIRKDLLDAYNRLHSIAEDASYIESVHKEYSSLPVVPNLRCGAWYTSPAIAGGAEAYFKSMDGHHGNWSFNLRRPNLHVLPLIIKHDGILLVDSTRSGKRIPDALSKTVPIWCAVINRATTLKSDPTKAAPASKASWDTQLYTPPQCVSPQEHVQIEGRLDNWVNDLLRSSYELPVLCKPLRPIWITPASSQHPAFNIETPFYPVVCVSASRSVTEGVGRRSSGYAYVQGSGDDHESWSNGLTPRLFWAHKESLMRATQSELPMLIHWLVTSQHLLLNGVIESHGAGRSSTDYQSATPIARVHGRLSIRALPGVHTVHTPVPSLQHSVLIEHDDPVAQLNITSNPVAPVVHPMPSTTELTDPPDPPKRYLRVQILGDKFIKHGAQSVKANLPQCLSFVHAWLTKHAHVTILCDEEASLDVGVGVLVAALQAFFDDHGELRVDISDAHRHGNNVSKNSIRTRLQWVIASYPKANPSRATLKRLNEYFLSDPIFAHINGVRNGWNV